MSRPMSAPIDSCCQSSCGDCGVEFGAVVVVPSELWGRVMRALAAASASSGTLKNRRTGGEDLAPAVFMSWTRAVDVAQGCTALLIEIERANIVAVQPQQAQKRERCDELIHGRRAPELYAADVADARAK